MSITRQKMKIWKFGQVDLSSTVVSDYAKISSKLGYVKLVRDESTGLYPTDSNLTVKLPVRSVPKLKSWDILQVISDTPKSENGAQATTIRGRIYNGTNSYYWNGSAWVITTSQWNTLTDIHNNLNSWQNTSISLEFELKTTDGKVSPKIREIRLLYTVNLPNQYTDWVYDTVIAQLQDNLRPMSNLVLASENNVSIDLNDYDLGADYDVTAIEAVFNDNTDPNHSSNLLSNYNASSKVITISAAQTFGHQLFIIYRYRPQISYQASQDYIEIATLPALVFDNIEFVDKGEAPEDDYIMNVYVDPPESVILPSPRRYDIVFSADLIAHMTTDLFLFQEELMKFIESRPTINSAACGDAATFTLEEQFSQTGQNMSQDVYKTRTVFKLENLYLQTQDAIAASSGSNKAKYGVKTINITTQFNNNTKVTAI